MAGQQRVPVIAVTGFLGAGKTGLLNHLLARPDARIGVFVNDFGTLNVDTVDPASFAPARETASTPFRPEISR